MKEAKISELIGKVITSIEKSDDEIHFFTLDRLHFQMFHVQDCCESVTVEDVIGDLDDLLNSPILEAEEVTQEEQSYSELTKL